MKKAEVMAGSKWILGHEPSVEVMTAGLETRSIEDLRQILVNTKEHQALNKDLQDFIC